MSRFIYRMNAFGHRTKHLLTRTHSNVVLLKTKMASRPTSHKSKTESTFATHVADSSHHGCQMYHVQHTKNAFRVHLVRSNNTGRPHRACSLKTERPRRAQARIAQECRGPTPRRPRTGRRRRSCWPPTWARAAPAQQPSPPLLTVCIDTQHTAEQQHQSTNFSNLHDLNTRQKTSHPLSSSLPAPPSPRRACSPAPS